MTRDSIIFAAAGIAFGLIVGWMLGSWQAGPGVARPPVAAAAPAQSAQNAPSGEATLDENRARRLEEAAASDPRDPAPRVELANLLFDAGRYQDAIRWYTEALSLTPLNVDARTDLGVAYYYLEQPDKALEQFERALSIDGRHVKTLLNLGVVRAFGKQDLPGAAAAWRQVLAIAPESAEGREAKRALDAMAAAHPDVTPSPPPPSPSSGKS
jgi:tetratricopeptide (TPR) repeat protein